MEVGLLGLKAMGPRSYAPASVRAAAGGRNKRMRGPERIFAGASLALLAACSANPTGSAPDANPKPVATGSLVYPETMRRRSETADVDIGCTVDVSGVPQSCKVLADNGNPEAAQAALQYVVRARYRPRTHNGVPVSAYHTWHIQFRLRPPTTRSPT